MFTFSEKLALVESESSFGAYVCHRRPGGSKRLAILSYINGATYTEMSLLKQYVAGERVDLLEVFICSKTVSMISKCSVSKTLGQQSLPSQS